MTLDLTAAKKEADEWMQEDATLITSKLVDSSSAVFVYYADKEFYVLRIFEGFDELHLSQDAQGDAEAIIKYFVGALK